MAKKSEEELEALKMTAGLLLEIFRDQSELIRQLKRTDAKVVSAIVQEMSAQARRRAKDSEDDTPRCSFCLKSEDELKKLIAGTKAFICDECVLLCMDIVREEPAEDASKD